MWVEPYAWPILEIQGEVNSEVAAMSRDHDQITLLEKYFVSVLSHLDASR